MQSIYALIGRLIENRKAKLNAIFVFEFKLKNFRYNNEKNKKINKLCEEYNILFVRRLKKINRQNIKYYAFYIIIILTNQNREKITID